MGTTKATKPKSKSKSAQPTKKTATKARAASSSEGDTLRIGVRGEREQLALIRQKLPALTDVESRAFVSMHSPDTSWITISGT